MTMQNPRPQQPPPGRRMTLAAVTKGKLRKPMRIVLYGVDKIGKSTFAASAPRPIFIGAEDGTSEIDVARFPEPHTWGDILDAVHVLTEEDHPYQTVAIDTLDWAERFLWRDLCARHGKKAIEDFPYGKGYNFALDDWNVLLSRLDALRARRGMTIILLAHAWIRNFKNPTGDDFDRYEMKVHAKAGGLVKEWVDAVLFADYETFTTKKGDGPGARSRGVSDGARIIHTQRRPAFDAGNRYGLPLTLPLSWDDFAEAVKNGAPEDLTALRASVDDLLPRVPVDVREKAEGWLASGANAKDPNGLARLAERLRARVLINHETSKEETAA